METSSERAPGAPRGGRPGGPPAAFLLAQVGAHAASQFATRLAALELMPPHAGILRILGAQPAITQQALAGALGTQPSRLVALVDELEARGLVERRENPDDRRRYDLHLTVAGRAMLEAVERVGREHQQAMLAALNEDEQRQLAGFLRRVADQQGLVPGVHPGYVRWGGGRRGVCDAPGGPTP